MTDIAQATAAFPDEVVTHAKQAVLDLPRDELSEERILRGSFAEELA